MPDVANIDAILGRHVERLREERGDAIRLTEVAEVVESLIETMEGDVSAGMVTVKGDLHDLVAYILQAKAEIAALSPSEIHDEHIPEAADQLDAVVKATEEATDAILDAAENLENLGAELPEEAREKITEIVTKIYEASNFQDITGQRISKVVAALKHIETKVRALAEAVGYELTRELTESVGDELDEDAALLNGPQIEGSGSSQEDIDKLFD